jgi:predicted transcriptional regulator YheO
MSPDEILQSYIPMLNFIADTYGKNCEVILHDLRKLDCSIIAIRNNHITGRKVNDTVTDFALKIIRNKDFYKNDDYIDNYIGKTNDGKKTLRASTYFIKDDEGNLIGMLCVNIDITVLCQTRDYIDNLIMDDSNNNKQNTNKECQENFCQNINDLVRTSISQVLGEYNIEPSRMTVEEKKQVVGDLENMGVFLLKGAVAEVASQLQVSDQTVYRYIKEHEMAK